MSSDEQRPEPDEQETRPSAGTEHDDSEADTEARERTPEPDEESPDEEADAEGPDGRSEVRRPKRSGPPRALVFGAAALASAALVVAVVCGVMWQTAASSDDVRIAEAREAVVAATSKAVVAFTGLDSTNPDEYFRGQKEIATGNLLKEIEETEQEYRDLLGKTKAEVESRVADVAVEELNVHEGKALALAVVELTVTQENDTGTKTLRMQLQLERDPSAGDVEDHPWKVSGISPVGYGAGG